MQDSCGRRRGEGDVMATGGISMELSWGGGCCHWGSGPARRRVCRSGPASITACRSFPFSGSGFLDTNFKVACGCNGCGNCGWKIGSVLGDEMMFSSESEEAKCLLESLPFGSSSMFEAASSCCCCGCSCCFCCSCCWSMSLSNIRFLHLVCASSLSLMVLLKRSLRWISSYSLFVISSLAARSVVSSSKVVYKRECLNSSTPCQLIDLEKCFPRTQHNHKKQKKE